MVPWPAAAVGVVIGRPAGASGTLSIDTMCVAVVAFSVVVNGGHLGQVVARPGRGRSDRVTPATPCAALTVPSKLALVRLRRDGSKALLLVQSGRTVRTRNAHAVSREPGATMAA
ncbi:hypothetical protein GCM10027265_07920 [Jatrophihabitans fulvus]